MLPITIKKNNFIRFGLLTSVGVLLTACSSLNQKAYEVDGIYNNSKIVVEDTHEKGGYYTEYFKEKTDSSGEIFTDVTSYVSNYEEGNAGWGDTTSETQLMYDFEWGMPYYGFGMYNSFWGFGYGYGWNDPFWGFGFGYGYGWGGYWGYPYYGYPYYGYNYRTISRINSHRALTGRSLSRANYANRGFNNNSQVVRNTRFNSTRNFVKSDRTFSRTTSTISRMNAVEQSNRMQTGRYKMDDLNNSSRNRNSINNYDRSNSNQIQRPTRSNFSPSSSSRSNSTGGFGGSRSGGSMGGGMRSGGGRR